ncbi:MULTISPECIES: hypothetical protein [unclassified Leptolyngbya]|uniref:hypothetical protein n=1 Tax=unclassified Leptolyngbya TaxID=2650499 RepID=UPI00168861C2|nr:MULTISPECIES: hypothetical protein [unclassified Leptolyngbya]MBD1911447.1 hypothetical protein [Leptolyngbya sp. FACHB-8]MBD2153459.1 hypothetical protein [Leptolyngbya sp. FACHB-16]
MGRSPPLAHSSDRPLLLTQAIAPSSSVKAIALIAPVLLSSDRLLLVLQASAQSKILVKAILSP